MIDSLLRFNIIYLQINKNSLKDFFVLFLQKKKNDGVDFFDESGIDTLSELFKQVTN